MLYETNDRDAVLEKLAGDSVAGFPFRNFARIGENDWRPTLLVDDLSEPRLAIIHAGSNFMLTGAIEKYIPAFEDLLAGNVKQAGGWPDENMQKDWDQAERRYLFINSTSYVAWRAALQAGFEPHPDDKDRHVAHLWYFTGEPRFAEMIKHPCRAVEKDTELLELMKQAVGYDPDGWYIKQCLLNGPSFVCEIDGQPVCWSCTHLNQTMGMIYTPEELRRHGYARSLAAFQIDHMLVRDGLACCHIIDHNTASMNLVASMGAEVVREPVVWRGVYWPGETPPAGQRTTKLTAGENEDDDTEDTKDA